jgi:hypothetical protein
MRNILFSAISCSPLAAALSGPDLACNWSMDRMVSHSYVCGDSGKCESTFTSLDDAMTLISCDIAVLEMAVAFGARTREPLPGGLLHQPIFIEHYFWPPPEFGKTILVAVTEADTAAAPAVVRENLMGLVNDIDTIVDELDFWAPRIVYLPDRIGGVLKSAYDHIHALSTLIDQDAVSIGFVASYLDHALNQFGYTVEHMTEMVMGMSDMTGFLHGLVPFLHLLCELNFAFPLAMIASEGFLVSQPSLVLTLSQMDPLYLGNDFVSWRFRFVNSKRVPWTEYTSERLLLGGFPLGRVGSPIYCPDEIDPEKCIETVVNTLEHVQGFVLGEYISEILHFLETYPTGEFRNMIYGVLERFFIANPAILSQGSYHPLTDVRARVMMVKFFRPLFSLETRVEIALARPRHDDTGEYFSQVYDPTETPEEMINAIGNDKIFEFHAVVEIEGLSEEWVERFTALVVRSSLSTAENGEVRIVPATPERTRRVIGRMLAYVTFARFWDAGGLLELVGANVGETHLEILFFGDEHVRMGFYDWFRFGQFEQLVDPNEISDAIKYIIGSP